MSKQLEKLLAKLNAEVTAYAEKEKNWLIRFTDESKGPYHDDVVEKTNRVIEIQRLQRILKDNAIVNKMRRVVEKSVKLFHEDFYYHDLLQIENYKGRFAWYVGDCGTHLITLDNESEDKEIAQKAWLDAIHQSYGEKYHLYLIDPKSGTMKKATKDKCEFKIV